MKLDFKMAVYNNPFVGEEMLTVCSSPELSEDQARNTWYAFLKVLSDNFSDKCCATIYGDLCRPCYREPQWFSSLVLATLKLFRSSVRATLAAEFMKIGLEWVDTNDCTS